MHRRRFLKNIAGVSVALSLPYSHFNKIFAASLPSDIIDFSAIDLSVAIKSKQVSSVEVMTKYLKHIDRYNPVYNAIISRVDADELLKQALQADQALAKGEYHGWMHGMPHAAKDLTAVKGLPYTSGSPMFADRIAEEDSGLVSRIRSAGAIFIGKTNTPEFGLGSQSYNPIFGATGCAWNPDRTAGGSSGGAASGLGTHMLPVADGSDMMGSLRNPGAFNNVLGFRPGTNIMQNEDPNDRALSTSGPMGRNMHDLIQLLKTIAVNGNFDGIAPIDLSSIRLGWMGSIDGYLPMEPGILDLCTKSLGVVEKAGAKIEPMLPDFSFEDLWFCWTTLRHSRRLNMLIYYDDPAKRELLKPELIWEIEQGMSFSKEDISRAKKIREEWYMALDKMFNDYDFLVLPTAQVFPFPKDIHWPEEINGKKMDTYHRWMEVVIYGSLGGLPVLNVPVGFDNQGRPMGMQIIGKYGNDKKVLQFGLAYEAITDFLNLRPVLRDQ